MFASVDDYAAMLAEEEDGLATNQVDLPAHKCPAMRAEARDGIH